MGNGKLCHFLRYDTPQFSLCTEHGYSGAVKAFNLGAMEGFTGFQELRRVDAEYRERLIRDMSAAHPKVFNLPDGASYKSNILSYRKDYGGLHPTQKPVALMADLIRAYTNEGGVVLDFTRGSGSTGVACKNLGRSFIGIERDPEYFAIAEARLS